jgi:glycosyltransferase involved in cell wall biosynthesis
MATATVPTRSGVRSLRILCAPDWRRGITYQDDLANALRDEQVTTVFLSHCRRGLPLFRGGRDLAPWDALHLHWPEAYIQSPAAWWKLRYIADLSITLGRRPLFLTAHNLYPHNRRNERLMRSVIRLTVRKASAIFVHSRNAALHYVQEFGARESQCRLIPFGDHAAAVGLPLPRAEARSRLSLPQGERICLMFGTVDPYKGQESVIAAWKTVRMPATLATTGPPVNPGYAAQIRSLAEGSPDIVLRIGDWLSPADLRLWLSAADAVVFNYRDILTSGAACLARSFGLPVLFPRRLDSVDIGEPHPSVFRFDSLVDDFPSLLERAVTRGLRYADAADWRARTSWASVAAVTADVYREFIES